MSAPLLLEIGCEEIPARMLAGAARDLALRLARVLDEAGLTHGALTVWEGTRRLAVRVESVPARQEDREERLLGPPLAQARDAHGALTPAALGFARKQGIDPAVLAEFETERGAYVGLARTVRGRSVGEVLAAGLPAEVESMSFPKTMRWSTGRWRWVRPVHWVLALHGDQVLPVRLFDIEARATSRGHRFLYAGDVAVPDADSYRAALEQAHVIVDPAERRSRLARALEAGAETLGGRAVDDPDLLREIADLVEWPGVVAGRFDPAFLDLPRELLSTTLRHHQKCFSVQGPDGALRPGFLAVANTDRDPGGHIRRGNEWVVGGRLEDARFFWREDRSLPLAARSERLAGVVFHGSRSYAEKVAGMVGLAAGIAKRLDGPDRPAVEHCVAAARLSKCDLLTGTVGEFPELQGRVGGLLLRAEGAPAAVADAVYAHYQPAAALEAIPPTAEGCVVALADKLDTLVELLRSGEVPTGSRDPFGLRRAANGVLRIVIERRWPLSLTDLVELAAGPPTALTFLAERLAHHLREQGATPNEVLAVLRPRIGEADYLHWSLDDIVARLRALAGVRARHDFTHLVELTKRVDNILTKSALSFTQAQANSGAPDAGEGPYREREPAVLELLALKERQGDAIAALESERRYADVIDLLASFVQPVDRFFADVLVIDPDAPRAMVFRRELLSQLKDVLTRCFDIRELAGQADRRP